MQLTAQSEIKETACTLSTVLDIILETDNGKLYFLLVDLPYHFIYQDNKCIAIFINNFGCFHLFLKESKLSNFFAIFYVTTLYASIILRLFKRQMTFCSFVIPHMLINAPKVSLFSFFVQCASQIFFSFFAKTNIVQTHFLKCYFYQQNIE